MSFASLLASHQVSANDNATGAPESDDEAAVGRLAGRKLGKLSDVLPKVSDDTAALYIGYNSLVTLEGSVRRPGARWRAFVRCCC